MQTGSDVAIIGAGIIGAALADALAALGAQVTVIDRHHPATGVTASTFAYINAATKRPDAYFRLNFAGIAEHARLRDELGDAAWRIETGRLLWHDDPQEMTALTALIEEATAWGYDTAWLTPADVAECEPDLRLPDGVTWVARFAGERAVDAAALARQLLERAQARGAQIRTGQAVIALSRRGARIGGVTLARGEQIAADWVINCAGPDADHVAQLAGRSLPLDPQIGIVAQVRTSARLRGIVDGNGLLVRPATRDGDRLLIQQNEADAALRAGSPAARVAEAMSASVRRLLPEHASIAPEQWTVAVRPIPRDGVSSAGLLPAIPGYGEIVTHSGVTLAPLLGRLVAAEIAGQAPDPLLASFRPERFR